MARFLVVDDSRVARLVIKNMLDKLGHEVICEAADGTNVFKTYIQMKPDYVTIDMEMPTVDGITVSRGLRKIDMNAKIIMITSIIDKKKNMQALESGVNQVLQKPITIEQLEQSINSLQ